jgi:hypothetical protein
LLAFVASRDEHYRLTQVSNLPFPNRTGAFQRIRLSSGPGFLVSAIGITPTFTATTPSHLAPFAL